MKKNISVWVLLGAALLLAACESRGPQPSESTMIGRQMPAFSLPAAFDGAMVNSDEFRGRAVLVNFFATWCPPCMEEVPHLIELQKKYDAAGFSVIGLSMDQAGVRPVKTLIARAGINYPVLMADESVNAGFGGIDAIPDSYLVDAQGIIVNRYQGYADPVLLETDIRKALPPQSPQP